MTSDLNNLKPGTWILVPFGTGTRLFYVMRKVDDSYILGLLEWESTEFEVMTVTQLRCWKVKVLGVTKKKWYWMFLPWRSLSCPFYAPNLIGV